MNQDPSFINEMHVSIYKDTKFPFIDNVSEVKDLHSLSKTLADPKIETIKNFDQIIILSQKNINKITELRDKLIKLENYKNNNNHSTDATEIELLADLNITLIENNDLKRDLIAYTSYYKNLYY